MFVSKQVSLSGSAVELTSGVTIDQPTTVLIQATSDIQVGSGSGLCVWQVKYFSGASPSVPGSLQRVRIDIEPGDEVWVNGSSGNVNALFMGR